MHEEAVRRFKLLESCEKDDALKSLEYELCRRDIKHFIKNWVWTFDPRLTQAHIPFLLYDYQIEALKWLDDRYENQEVGLIEKSRDMGATWILVVWSVHKWLFEPGFTCLFGSRTQEAVDGPSMDSIFAKVRYVIYKLPSFLRPDMTKKISEKRDSDTYLSIVNPSNGNELSGDSANENFGRSGRRSVVFLDEYAFVPQSERIWAAVSEVSNVVIPVSTPNGKGNMFYTLRSKGTVPVLTLHWSRHPNKDQQWYDEKKKHLEKWQIQSELDISYDQSKAGVVYTNFRRDLHVAKESIEFDASFEQFATLDFGIRDAMVVIFGQIDFYENVEIISEFYATDFDIELFIYLLKGKMPPDHLWSYMDDKIKARYKECLRKVFYSGSIANERTIYGDHAGTARSANNKRSIRDRLKIEGGFDLVTSRKQDFANRIQCFHNLLKPKQMRGSKQISSRFIISPECQFTIDSITNYVWASENETAHPRPKHDEWSHATSALEFFAINRFPVVSTGGVVVEKFR